MKGEQETASNFNLTCELFGLILIIVFLTFNESIFKVQTSTGQSP